MIFVFYFFAAVLIWLSYRSLRGGIAYLRYFQTELAKPRSEFTPFVTVVAPCRGVDTGLAENLLALLAQDYPEYEVIFVVDDKNDPAVAVIDELFNRRDAKTQRRLDRPGNETSDTSSSAALRLRGENPVETDLIIAPKAGGCSQKVENLREAVLHASERSEAFVFVDSDARPSSDWLRNLVAPLEDEAVGASTGYRWFIAPQPTFASELRSCWNASIASALGPNVKTNFCWGGSMAMRRDVFEQLDIREKWRGTLSDDFVVTRAVKDAGLQIAFVPQALTASVENCTFGEMLEFTTRQMKITRVYATPLWILSFFGSALFCGVMLAAFLIVVLGRSNGLSVAVALTTLILVSTFSIGKALLRLRAVQLVLTNYRRELARQFWTQNTLWLLTPAVFLYNSVAALFSTRMTWRGTTYELKSPSETVIITD